MTLPFLIRILDRRDTDTCASFQKYSSPLDSSVWFVWFVANQIDRVLRRELILIWILVSSGLVLLVRL